MVCNESTSIFVGFTNKNLVGVNSPVLVLLAFALEYALHPEWLVGMLGGLSKHTLIRFKRDAFH
jgi:hypothetical protein